MFDQILRLVLSSSQNMDLQGMLLPSGLVLHMGWTATTQRGVCDVTLDGLRSVAQPLGVIRRGVRVG